MAKLQLCYWLFLVSFALYAKVVLSYQHQSFGIRNQGLLTSGKGFFPIYRKSHHLFLPIAEILNKIHSYLSSGVDKTQNLLWTTKSQGYGELQGLFVVPYFLR